MSPSQRGNPKRLVAATLQDAGRGPCDLNVRRVLGLPQNPPKPTSWLISRNAWLTCHMACSAQFFGPKSGGFANTHGNFFANQVTWPGTSLEAQAVQVIASYGPETPDPVTQARSFQQPHLSTWWTVEPHNLARKWIKFERKSGKRKSEIGGMRSC